MPEINHPYDKDRGTYSAGIKVYPDAALEAFVVDTFAGAARYFQGDASYQADLRTVRSIERATGQPTSLYSGNGGRGAFRAAPVGFYQWNPSDPSLRRELRIVRHQMLGAATRLQNVAEQARAEGWVSLLQIDSDRALHESFMFCDMGMAQFWIRPEDLRNNRFDRAWATTEGG